MRRGQEGPLEKLAEVKGGEEFSSGRRGRDADKRGDHLMRSEVERSLNTQIAAPRLAWFLM